MKFRPIERIFFRSSLEPLQVRTGSIDELKNWLLKPQTESALAIAYPNLCENVFPVSDANWKRVCNDSDLLRVLFELQTRAIYSTVPLGTFVGVGEFAVQKSVSLDSRAKDFKVHFFDKSFKPNWDVIAENFSSIKFLQSNPTRFNKMGQVTYVISIPGKRGTIYDWDSIAHDITIEKLLAFLDEPKTVQKSLAFLSKYGIDRSTGKSILIELAQQQVILTDLLEDKFTLRKPILSSSLDQIKEIPKTRHALDAVVIGEMQKEAKFPSQILSEIRLASEFQIALHLATSKLIDYEIKFRQSFTGIYDTHAVPLLDVVDPMKGFALPRQIEPEETKTALPESFAGLLNEHLRSKKPITLTNEFVSRFLQRHPIPSEKQNSFASSFFLTGTEQTQEMKVWLRKIFPAPGVRPMGRFLRYFPGMGAGDLLPKVPKNCIWAEMGGAPQHKNKDLFEVERKNLPYIDFYSTPRPSKDRISVEELFVVHRNGLLWLWSKKRRQFVIPVNSNSAGLLLDPHPVSRFLSYVSFQFCTDDVTFPWGSMALLPWLPSVQLGNVILTPQRWTFTQEEMKRGLGGSIGDARKWLEKSISAESKVLSVHAETELFVDLRLPTAVETVRRQAAKHQFLTFQEGIPDDSLLGIRRDGYNFNTEYIQEFINDEFPIVAPVFSNEKFRGVNDSVLYFNIFSLYEAHQKILEIFSKELNTQNLKWFFIRYNDEGGCLRIRIFCKNSDHRLKVLKKFESILSRKQTRDLYRTYRVERYQFETDVYGDEELFHTISNLDSVCTMQVLRHVSECENQQIELLTAAWISCLMYLGYLGQEYLFESRVSEPKNENSDDFREAKKLAIERLTNSSSDPLVKIFKSRDAAFKKVRVPNSFAKLPRGERQVWIGRLVHLALNRLAPGLLLPFEAAFLQQGSVSYIQNQLAPKKNNRKRK